MVTFEILDKWVDFYVDGVKIDGKSISRIARINITNPAYLFGYFSYLGDQPALQLELRQALLVARDMLLDMQIIHEK